MTNNPAGWSRWYGVLVAADASSTRTRLLAAAREEFAAHGIAGARVDRIARLAGVNKERIYGYFGSKERLFDAVVAEAKIEHVTALGNPSGDLAEYVGRLYDYHRDHPTLLRLLLWEALYYGSEPPADAGRRTALYGDKIDALAGALGAEPNRDTAATLHTLIGLAVWPHAMPQLRRFMLYADDEETAHRAIRSQVVNFARRAVPAPGHG